MSPAGSGHVTWAYRGTHQRPVFRAQGRLLLFMWKLPSGHSCCRLAPQIYHSLGPAGASEDLSKPQAVQCLLLRGFLPPHFPLPPSAWEILLRTQMNFRSSLSEQNSLHSGVHGKVFSWVKLRYVVGKVRKERPKFEKSRIRLW